MTRTEAEALSAQRKDLADKRKFALDKSLFKKLGGIKRLAGFIDKRLAEIGDQLLKAKRCLICAEPIDKGHHTHYGCALNS